MTPGIVDDTFKDYPSGGLSTATAVVTEGLVPCKARLETIGSHSVTHQGSGQDALDQSRLAPVVGHVFPSNICDLPLVIPDQRTMSVGRHQAYQEFLNATIPRAVATYPIQDITDTLSISPQTQSSYIQYLEHLSTTHPYPDLPPQELTGAVSDAIIVSKSL
jgi:hypothetical protein